MKNIHRIKTIEPHPNETWSPRADLSCGRISVILGSNGSGKSEFLRQIIHLIVVERKYQYLYIESNRRVGDELISVKIVPGDMDTPEKAERHYKTTRGGSLSQRIKYSLILLRQRNFKQRELYYDSLRLWDENGRVSSAPIKKETDFEKAIRLFQEIFPYIEIRVTESDQLYLTQNSGKEYPITQASEGERQVFSLLSDVILNSPESNFVAIVDEPETHLNPLLADQVWNVLEQALPDAQFIYASHSVAFAMRPSVDSLFFVGKHLKGVLPIDDVSLLSEDELRDLIGAIPAIVSAKRTLCVEGGASSFDIPFYRWILDNKEIKVVPLGAKTDVEANTKRLDLWKKLAPSCAIVGVIDRDFRGSTNSNLDSLLVLDFHEAESYLCIPSLIVDVDNIISGGKVFSDVHKVAEEIIVFAKEELNEVVTQHVFQKINFSKNMSISPGLLSEVRKAEHSLEDILKSEAQKMSDYILMMISDGLIAQTIGTERNICENEIEKKNINELLKLFPGKKLLSRLATKLGIKPLDILSVVKNNFKAENYTELMKLKTEIEKRLMLIN